MTGERTHKQCPKCGESKPVGEFYLRSTGKPQSYCKTCTRTYVQSRHVPKKPWEAGYKKRKSE